MKKLLGVSVSGLLILVMILASALPAGAVGNGPYYGGNETIKLESLTSYEDLVAELAKADSKSDLLEVEVFGQSVKGRDLSLVKFGNNPDNPTILFLTQQHGNEGINTEGALHYIKKLSTESKENRELADKINIFFVPRLNVDGAEGDVNFDISYYHGGGQTTRYNANEVDLNRDHVDREQPETAALHENVFQKYDIDYMIDFHHQSASGQLDGELVSGSILYPTNEGVDPEVVEKSKQLGAVMYNAVESKGWGLLEKYRGGSANTISRNGLAYEYGIATLLFEVRGMTDHAWESYILGQKSNGYLAQQAVVSMEAAVQAIADGSIHQADTSFWDTLGN